MGVDLTPPLHTVPSVNGTGSSRESPDATWHTDCLWRSAVPHSSDRGAQATTGEITGRVVDSTGNVVPGTTVTARNEGTGFTRVAVTNNTGDYLLTQLPPGRYTVTAELTGFKTAVMEGIELNVGSRLTLPMTLEVGDMSRDGERQLAGLAHRDDAVGHRRRGHAARDPNLPVLNRTFANLSVIMPEARPVGNFDPTKTRIGNVAMNGGDGRQLDVNVDGGDNKDNVVGSLIQNFAYESIQEFQVLQHRWTAESGRAVGGVVNVITKSGTNSCAARRSAVTATRKRGRSTSSRAAAGGDLDFTKPEFERRSTAGRSAGPSRATASSSSARSSGSAKRSNNPLTQRRLQPAERDPRARPVSASRRRTTTRCSRSRPTGAVAQPVDVLPLLACRNSRRRTTRSRCRPRPT
jgi:hypothetical protein